MKQLSNQPPKGTSDWFPEEFAIRKYIFDTWRKVCTQFGYKEYLTPIIESADVYRAKSGEDIGGKELMVMTDRAGRELAIRPEMTPSVTRMVTRVYQESPKPLRLFSIANFLRNEKPQRGRNREFWQLNFDIFGSESINADVEVLQMALEIMLAFNPPKGSFKMKLNDRTYKQKMQRKFFPYITNDQSILVTRQEDKLEKQGYDTTVQNISTITTSQPALVENYLKITKSEDYFSKVDDSQEEWNKNFTEIVTTLQSFGYGDYIEVDGSLARGFDYYDGMVFEVFDKNPDNNRSLFGGGRYNGLAGIFGSQSFPAVGCAPGDETTKLFLEAWNLIPDNLRPSKTFIPLLEESLIEDIQNLTKKLRSEGKNVEVGLEVQKIGKALDYANKEKINDVILLGEDEKKKGMYLIKNMETGEQKEIKL